MGDMPIGKLLFRLSPPVMLAWAFHFAGLTYVWLTFPVTEVLSVLCALVFYRRTPFLSKRRNAE